MPIRHGVYVSEKQTSVSTPVVAPSGIPFVIGASPIQSAEAPAKVGIPQLCSSYDEFVAAFGYSDDWASYNLCEAAYSHFKLFGCQPIIFVNLLDPATMNGSQAAADIDVVNHRAELPIEAIDDTNLVVKTSGGTGNAYVKDTDYAVFYSGEHCYVELLAGTHYDETALNIAYKKVTPSSVTATVVSQNMDTMELCLSTIGTVPDLILAPGYTESNLVSAVMATKAAGINGLFRAKAIIDIDSSNASGAVRAYTGVSAYKTANNLTDENEILCWPQVKLGSKQFHMSVQLAGLMAQVDSGNECPYESPSNKNFKMDTLVLQDGTVVNQTKAQADTINGVGVVTALNFMASGWVCWGNYTACYPSNTDVKDYFIPVSRMFDWVANTLIQTFWSKLDSPMNRRLIDTILDSSNIWLNGLTGRGFLLGARAEMLEAENPLTDLMQGIIRIHIYMTPPSPAQEIDFVLEYDVNYVESALV